MPRRLFSGEFMHNDPTVKWLNWIEAFIIISILTLVAIFGK